MAPVRADTSVAIWLAAGSVLFSTVTKTGNSAVSIDDSFSA